MSGRDNASTGEPRVSVILPTYDRPTIVPTAVESVVEQSFEDLELIIVDDHSHRPVEKLIDDSLVEAVDHRIIRHDRNKGANEARKTGIRAATGKLLAFLDDDDVWKEDKLEKQVAVFERGDENLGVVYTGQEYVDEAGRTTYIHTPAVTGNVTRQMLQGEPVGNFSSIMVKSDILAKVGMPDSRLPSWQDRDWLLRLSQHCTFKPVREPLVIRRFIAAEQISDDFEAKRDVSYPLFLQKHRPLAREHGPTMEHQFVAQLTRQLARRGLKTGHYREAARYLVRSLRYEPYSVQAYLMLIVCMGGGITYNFARWISWYYRRWTVKLQRSSTS